MKNTKQKVRFPKEVVQPGWASLIFLLCKNILFITTSDFLFCMTVILENFFVRLFFLSKTKQKTLLWIKNLCPVDQPNLCKVRFRSFEMFENSFFSRKWKQMCICIYRKSYRKIFDTILQLNMKSYPISFIHLKNCFYFRMSWVSMCKASS